MWTLPSFSEPTFQQLLAPNKLLQLNCMLNYLTINLLRPFSLWRITTLSERQDSYFYCYEQYLLYYAENCICLIHCFICIPSLKSGTGQEFNKHLLGERKKERTSQYGNSLAVQWLGFGMARVQSLARELRSHQMAWHSQRNKFQEMNE